MDILEIWDDTQYWHTTDVLEHLPSLIEESHIASELVYDDTLDEFPVFWSLEGDAAINRSEYSTSVNISHKDYISLGMSGHRKIHEVGIPEVYF